MAFYLELENAGNVLAQVIDGPVVYRVQIRGLIGMNDLYRGLCLQGQRALRGLRQVGGCPAAVVKAGGCPAGGNVPPVDEFGAVYITGSDRMLRDTPGFVRDNCLTCAVIIGELQRNRLSFYIDSPLF